MNSKVIIVTGASRGIGRTVAYELAKIGHIVIANYNKSENDALALKKKADLENLFLDIFKADVSNRNDVRQLVTYTLNKYNHIDVLINNAGVSSFNLFTDISDDEWHNVLNTNLYSAFCVTQEVLPNMISNKNGCIINLSSIWGLVGSSCESLYSISKAGIDALTKSLAKELGPSNIRVNSIAPGIIDTDMNKNLSEETINVIKEDIPLGRIGTPENISSCIKWLINDDYTSGQIISINGGWVVT